jgi:opacity protein-like surface antigen
LISIFAILGITSAHSQALATATRGAEITAFGGYTASAPDFETFAPGGFTAGANYTLFPKHLFIDPSVEFRYDYTHSSGVSEHGYFVGPRLQKDIFGGRVHPYVDALYGKGTINLHPPSSGVASAWGGAWSYGGGVDLEVSKHLSLKLDLQQQEWNLGKNAALKPDGSDFTLSPKTYTLGVTYHFTFSELRNQRELK